jgi:putative transposase
MPPMPRRGNPRTRNRPERGRQRRLVGDIGLDPGRPGCRGVRDITKSSGSAAAAAPTGRTVSRAHLQRVTPSRAARLKSFDSMTVNHPVVPQASAPEVAMRGPKPPAVTLSDSQRKDLEAFLGRHSAPQQAVLRARPILAAADGLNNSRIARLLAISAATARTWRDRWLALGGVPCEAQSVADCFADAPRPGRPTRITAEQVCRVVALACEAPAKSGRPITYWSGHEVADEIVNRGIVARISPRHAARPLKTEGPQAALGAALADARERRAVRGRRLRNVRPLSRGPGAGRAR